MGKRKCCIPTFSMGHFFISSALNTVSMGESLHFKFQVALDGRKTKHYIFEHIVFISSCFFLRAEEYATSISFVYESDSIYGNKTQWFCRKKEKVSFPPTVTHRQRICLANNFASLCATSQDI
jgi:hypothetical protein